MISFSKARQGTASRRKVYFNTNKERVSRGKLTNDD
jgi:hypothetical protein